MTCDFCGGPILDDEECLFGHYGVNHTRCLRSAELREKVRDLEERVQKLEQNKDDGK
jgi:hypothetical protein